MRHLVSCVAIVFLLSPACAPPVEPPAPAIDLAAERSGLMDADKAWYETYSGSETPVDSLLSAVVEDAHFQSAGNAPAHGKDQIRSVFEQMHAVPGFALEWNATAADVSSCGDLGYTVGTYEMNMEVDGKPVTENGHYVTIWKKQEDGTWKVVFDGGGPNAPPGGPTQ